MVTEATKKYRDLIAFGLLGVVALYLISGLSLLFKGENDSGLSFSGRAATFEHIFTDPLVVLSLVLAVALAVGWGQSRQARIIVLAALALGALALLLALICWLAALGADEFGTSSGVFGGVLGAGKIVGFLIGLAQLLFLAMAVLFAASAFRALPKAVKAQNTSWDPSQQSAYAGWQQQQGGASAAQGGWSQGSPAYEQGYPDATGYPQQAGFAQGQSGYGQQWPQQSPYGTAPAYGAPAHEQGWNQPPQQTGPVTASSWEQPSAPQPNPPQQSPPPQSPPPQSPPPQSAAPQSPPPQRPNVAGANAADEPPPLAESQGSAAADPQPGSESDDDADGHDRSGWWRPSS